MCETLIIPPPVPLLSSPLAYLAANTTAVTITEPGETVVVPVTMPQLGVSTEDTATVKRRSVRPAGQLGAWTQR
jgi:hypothetical protein